MLKLINIEKNYYMGSTTVQALKKVNLEFRKSEFVILGPRLCKHDSVKPHRGT